MLPGELTLDDMLAEPIVQLLMRRDRVDEAELRLLMRNAQISTIAARNSDSLNAALEAR
jgi:hypothetical protein